MKLLYGQMLVPGAALYWSIRGGPAGDPGSLDPSDVSTTKVDQ
jgi:hypothetical protein